jgi:beta-galactosidase
MRTITPVILVLALCAAAAAKPVPADDGRKLANLSPGWKFLAGDDPMPGSRRSTTARGRRSTFPTPGTASTGRTAATTTGAAPAGTGGTSRWTRSLGGKRLYLLRRRLPEADVYVNGVHLGSHTGGFARFVFDATAP